MGNIVARVGTEPMCLAFWASMLPLHHIASLMSPLYARLTLYVASCLRGQSVQTYYTSDSCHHLGLGSGCIHATTHVRNAHLFSFTFVR